MEADRARVEDMYFDGVSVKDISEAYRVPLVTTHHILRKVFCLPLRPRADRKPRRSSSGGRAAGFRKGARYEVDGRNYRFFRTIHCASGKMHVFRATPGGWTETFTPSQLMYCLVLEVGR